MKILILLIICILSLTEQAFAQYKINKQKYNTLNYHFQKSDKVSPAIAGVASFFVPGLGQALSGEYARGLAFFGGYSGGAALYYAGHKITKNTHSSGGFGDDKGLLLKIAGIGSMIGVQIASIADAVKVTKINNLAIRDKNDNITALLSLMPYTRCNRMDLCSFKETGLCVKLRF